MGGRMPIYDPATALIVVDVQNDFADPSGSLYVKGGEEVVPIVNDEIGMARARGAPVFYTRDWHPERTPHFVTDGGMWPVHCVRDTWGAELHPDLAVEGELIHKGISGADGYSGFTERDPHTGELAPTDLADLLTRAGVRSVVVCGLATDYCVKATALDARGLGYPTTVLTNAVRAVDLADGDGERALAELVEAGAVLEDGRRHSRPGGGDASDDRSPAATPGPGRFARSRRHSRPGGGDAS
jgi:nicotinamidase/pyrazinamidase